MTGGTAGILTGMLLFVLAWFASGGLGTQRLAHVGVRLGGLAITAPCILGLVGLVTGLVVGLARREWPTWRRHCAETDQDSSVQRGGEEEQTLRR